MKPRITILDGQFVVQCGTAWYALPVARGLSKAVAIALFLAKYSTQK